MGQVDSAQITESTENLFSAMLMLMFMIVK